jgi:hypothetical protein
MEETFAGAGELAGGGTLKPVTDEWLTRSNAKGLDLDKWFENFTSR